MTALPKDPKKKRSAFSLVELLLVMAIISILLGLGTFVLPRPDPVSGGQIVSSLIERARIQAIALGRPTAVLILTETDVEDRLKKIGVVQQSGVDPSTERPTWRFDSNPTFVPAGLVFNEDACTSDESGTDARRIRIPVLGGSEGEGVEWFFYGYSAGGEPMQPGGTIVIGDPRRDDDIRVELTRSGRPGPLVSNRSQ